MRNEGPCGTFSNTSEISPFHTMSASSLPMTSAGVSLGRVFFTAATASVEPASPPPTASAAPSSSSRSDSVPLALREARARETQKQHTVRCQTHFSCVLIGVALQQWVLIRRAIQDAVLGQDGLLLDATCKVDAPLPRVHLNRSTLLRRNTTPSAEAKTGFTLSRLFAELFPPVRMSAVLAPGNAGTAR
jgi:hypothetical protein